VRRVPVACAVDRGETSAKGRTTTSAGQADHSGDEHDHVRAFRRRQACRGHIRAASRMSSSRWTARIRGKVRAGLEGRADARRSRMPRSAQVGLGCHQSAAAVRACSMKFLELVRARQRRSSPISSRASMARPSPDAKGDIQRGTRGDRVRLRHPAHAEGRIHRRARARHRRLFDAPAARRRRRHHAVQLPGHDPDVEVRARASPAATPSS